MRKVFIKTRLFVIYLGSILLLFVNSVTYAAFDKVLVANLIHSYLPNTHVGIMVQDVGTGKNVYEYHSDENFMPASNTKLFTAAAALLGLGADYQYQTTFAYEANRLEKGILHGNIYLHFSGDPSFTDRDLSRMVAELKKKGVHKIDGNIIFDSSRFKKPNYLLGTNFEDLNWYYSAPVPAIIVNQNKVQLYLKPNRKLSLPAKVLPRYGMEYVTFSNHVKTVSFDEAEKHCQLLLDVNEKNHIDLKGCWPIYGASPELNIAVRNPTAFTENILKKYLRLYHVKFNGVFKEGQMPPLKKDISKIVHFSEPLKTLVSTMLKESNNLYAISLTKTLGAKYFQQGTNQEGINAIKMLLLNQYGLSLDDAEIRDGVGTQYNLVSPEKMVQLLRYVYYDAAIYSIFLGALPNSSHPKGSTFAKIINFQDLPPNVHAKTGRLHTSSTLSGYMKAADGHMLIFSFMMDDTRAFDQATALQAQLCQYFSKVF